jgi:hypothetical protein
VLSGDEHESGFEVTRAKIIFDGNVINPRWQYSVGLLTFNTDEDIALDHALIAYQVDDNLKVWVGETKAPFLREEITASTHQLAVERSLVNEIFTLGRVQGLGVMWDATDAVRLSGTIYDGFRSGEPGGILHFAPNKDFKEDSSDFAIGGRFDWKIMGEWAQMEDFSAWDGEPTALFFGAATYYDIVETGDGNTSPIGLTQADKIWGWTVDASAEFNGFNIYAAGTGILAETTSGVPEFDAFAAVVQAGYFVIPNKLEPFARYEYVSLDSDLGNLAVAPFTDSDIDELHLFTFGANYYFAKQRAKFTLDLIWSPEPLDLANTGGATVLSPVLGLMPDTAGSEDQIAVRAQLQLMF